MESKPPLPTLGRIVHYWERVQGRLEPMPAIVNGVDGNSMFADLDVRGRTVKLQRNRVPYSAAPADGFWGWPPRETK